MKVSTDACIQGAWTPIAEDVRHVLDIGTGTGLLSLMLAQRKANVLIDAIEMDKSAAGQAEQNVKASSWAERINVLCGDVRNFTFGQQYDMVICNPPFFNNSLLGDDAERNAARHTLSLSYNDLLRVMEQVLTETGYASVILPSTEYKAWAQLLKQYRWHMHRRLFVMPKAETDPNRVVSVFGKSMPETLVDERLVIYAGQNQYTLDAADLLSPFYLKL